MSRIKILVGFFTALILVSLFFIFTNFSYFTASDKGIDSYSICNPDLDRDEDDIPDDLTPKKNVDWSNCNLTGINFSSDDEFDYRESLRPFTWGNRQHTTLYAESLRDGIPNDAHTFRQNANLGKIDSTLEILYSYFGLDYDQDDNFIQVQILKMQILLMQY